jgi:hypothetical protein
MVDAGSSHDRAIFLPCVAEVRALSANEEMSGISAAPVVASMQNVQTVRIADIVQ